MGNKRSKSRIELFLTLRNIFGTDKAIEKMRDLGFSVPKGAKKIGDELDKEMVDGIIDILNDLRSTPDK